MGLFDSIPIRTNAKTDTVTAAWWNTIRSKLIEFAGGGVTAETEWTVTDNQSSYSNISGLSFDVATYSYVKIRYTIWRYDGSNERKESGTLELTGKKNGETWDLSRRSNGDDALNISGSLALDVTSGVAQVQYKSDSMGGSYEEKAYYRVLETVSAD